MTNANIPPIPRILTVKSMRKHVLLYGFYDVVYEEDAEVTAQIEHAFTEWTASAKISTEGVRSSESERHNT